MVNGDPNTFMFFVPLKITYPSGARTYRNAHIGGSCYEQAAENAVNCYKAWYKDCKVEVA